MHVCMLKVLSHAQFFEAPWTIVHWASLSMEFSRQEYWSGLPFPFPWDLPNSGIKYLSFVSPALIGGFFTYVPDIVYVWLIHVAVQ